MIRRLPTAVLCTALALSSAVALAAPKAKPAADASGGGNPEKLIKEFSDAVKKAPDDSESWYNLALAYYNAKKYDDAASTVAKAAELNSGSISVMQLTGAIAAKQGKKDAAIAAYEKAREAETKDGGAASAVTVMGLGGAYYDAERWEDAVGAYKAAWKLVNAGEKGDITAINNKIGTAYLRAGNSDEALRWFEKNAEKDPDSAATAYNLGMTYRKLAIGGNASMWAAAAAKFKKAADIDSSDAFAQFFAGEALLISGSKAASIPYLDRYLAADPDGKKAVAKFGATGKSEVFDAAKEYKVEAAKP